MLNLDNSDKGKIVKKISNKPFKSTFMKNTIKGVITHSRTGRGAYTFLEDDSHVEAWKCEEVIE